MFARVLPLVLAGLLAAAREPDELGPRLAQLGAPRAEERAAAERWLATHLTLERYSELAAAAEAADAEVRARLVRVLASDERHLELALELCVERAPELAALGREAVRAGVARWDPRLAEPGLRERPGLELLLRAAASESPPRLLALDAERQLDEWVEALELAGELPLGLAFDARVATKRIRRPEGLEPAPWDELVLRLARALGIGIECHGLSPARPDEVPPGAFLLFVPEAEPVATGAERVAEWLFTLAAGNGAESEARVAAALALASSGFAPALEWMDRLVARRGDRAARAGLLRAAALGRVAPSLTGPGVLEELLGDVVGSELFELRRTAPLVAALVRLGCFDARGAPLAPRFAAVLAGPSLAARWLRLFLAERGACADPESLALARTTLAEESAPPALRLRALFLLASRPDVDPTPAARNLAALFALELARADRERLARSLARLGLAPPHPDPATIPSALDARARLDLLEAWLWSGADEPAAAHLAAWLGEDAPARCARRADALRPWLGRGARARLEGVLARATTLAPARATAVTRVRLLLGLLPPAEVPGWLVAQRIPLQGPEADLTVVGALGGYPVPLAFSTPARAELVARLAAAAEEGRAVAAAGELLGALERAIDGMVAAGRDEEALEFLAELTKTARARRGELARFLERPGWPAPPTTEVRDLEQALARLALPAF
jgi:hypothetical protein